MFIGIPKELKEYEYRVAITPAMVRMLTDQGHQVVIETGAGDGSKISNLQYQNEGARISQDAAEIWQQQLVVKVKEPQACEYVYFNQNLKIFCYLHLAANAELTQVLCDSGVCALAFETLEEDHELPLLRPMSEVAGYRAALIAARLHEQQYNGMGILLGGVPGVEAAKVVIVGGGSAGSSAAQIALGIGARVVLLEISEKRLRELDVMFGKRITLVKSNSYNIAQQLVDADVLISSVLVPGAKAPQVVSEDMVKHMPESSVIIDIAIDQGGSVATIDRCTSHADPVYRKHGILHYAVPNIPGATPRTSTFALANAIGAYVCELANGCEQKSTPRWWGSALNVYQGKIVLPALAKTYAQKLQAV